MINLLRSDFYKLLTRKSFYICGAISALLGILGVIMMNSTIRGLGIDIDPRVFGLTGINAMASGMANVTLLSTIFLSMFVSSEFSFGTIKNMASRGAGRINIYLSKLIMGVFTIVSYTVVSAAVGFAAGTIMWGAGEFSQEIGLNILRMAGLFLLAEISLQALFIMISFIVRHTGGSIAINLVIIMIATPIILAFIDYACIEWLNTEIKSSDYWVATYTQNYFVSLNIENEVIQRGVITCLIYLIASTAVGMFTFKKRDIK